MKRNLPGMACLLLLVIATILTPISTQAEGIHRCQMDKGKMLSLAENGQARAVIVLPKNANRILRFSAQELKTFLEQATQATFAIADQPDATKVNLMLGEELFRAAGGSLEKVPLDGFVIQAKGRNIHLAGRDGSGDPVAEAGGWCKWERGTLTAVYDFLERFAGVRFYFPGKTGTIVPVNKSLSVPSMEIAEAPDFITRKVISGVKPIPGRPTVCSWYEGSQEERNSVVKKAGMNVYRLRASSISVNAIHGLAQLGYVHRFAKTHPEYFALTEKGERYVKPVRGWDISHEGIYGQLCLSNPGLKEQVFQDAKAFLTGKSAREAGVDLGPKNGGFRWPGSFVPGYFDAMPNDSFYMCHCELCQKEAAKGEQGVSDHVWRFVRELGYRLKKENIPGFISMMSYNPYRNVPSFDLPDNLRITIAAVGPWSYGTRRMRDDVAHFNQWIGKMHAKVGCVWTYPGDPHRALPDLPMMTPKSVGHYFKEIAPLAEGALFEGETDHYIFQYLNYYLFSRMAWDASQDPDAILREHYSLMFGPAAEPMRQAYEILEECWLKIYDRGNQSNASKIDIPNETERWLKIYTKERVDKLNSLLGQAEKLTASSPDALARIRFMRQELFGPMMTARAKWAAERSQVADWSASATRLTKPNEIISIDGALSDAPWKKIYPLTLGKMNDSARTPGGNIRLATKDGKLIVAFDFPNRAKDQLKFADANDKGNTFWFGTEAEALFLLPDGHLRQYAFNPSGQLRILSYSTKEMRLVPEGEATSQATVQCTSTPTGWSAELSIPVAELGADELKGNFCYSEVPREGKGSHFTWSPFLKQGFQEVDNFGVIRLVDRNLIRNSEFQQEVVKGKIPFWAVSKPGIFELSTQVRRSDSPSLKCTTNGGRLYSSQQVVGLKPDTTYRFSFNMRMDLKKLRPGSTGGAYATISIGKQLTIPKIPMDGTHDWTKIVETFHTPKDLNPGRCFLTLGVFDVSGEVYFDGIRIEEVPNP